MRMNTLDNDSDLFSVDLYSSMSRSSHRIMHIASLKFRASIPQTLRFSIRLLPTLIPGIARVNVNLPLYGVRTCTFLSHYLIVVE